MTLECSLEFVTVTKPSKNNCLPDFALTAVPTTPLFPTRRTLPIPKITNGIAPINLRDLIVVVATGQYIGSRSPTVHPLNGCIIIVTVWTLFAPRTSHRLILRSLPTLQSFTILPWRNLLLFNQVLLFSNSDSN